MTFTLADEEYGIGILKIKEIIFEQTTTKDKKVKGDTKNV